MSLWDRALGALGVRKTTGEVAYEEGRIVLRDLARARALPQEPAERGSEQIRACKLCQAPVRQVIFTTAGSGDQEKIWRQYPLAVDGWVCVSCGWSAMPRRISAEESVEFGRRGAEHAGHGQFDDAEFWIRRIVASWPGYPGGYADLGQLALARADAAKQPKDKTQLRKDAIAWFRRAIGADLDGRFAGVRIPFARALALSGDETEALELLADVPSTPSATDEVKTEAATLVAQILEGKALFSRATELVGETVLEPLGKPLPAERREALELGRSLLRKCRERSKTFATSWYLGKVELRLGLVADAVVALEEAHALKPDHPDGCRELCSAYLEFDDAAAALPIARRAVELRPEDAGLHANLALTQLILGDVNAAHAQVQRALAVHPGDPITRTLANIIEQVRAGRRPCPRSLRELENRAR